MTDKNLRAQPQAREDAGPAEPEVGRVIYKRIEKLLTDDPQGWERAYLSHLVASVEEVGGYDGPQAREDAQPVGWLRAADEEMVCAHLGVAEAGDSYETAKKKLASLIQWNIAVAMGPSVRGRPAPDALRVAVEALPRWEHYNGGVTEDFVTEADPNGEWVRYSDLTKALAALQQEGLDYVG